MKPCVFCQIIAGELPAAVIYEDATALVILDLFPVSEGHAMVVSRQHCATISELPLADTQHMLKLVRATISAIHAAGFNVSAQNLLINDGPDSNQHIPHVHWHIIPRRKGDSMRTLWRFFTRFLNPFGIAQRQQRHQQLAETLREHFTL